MKRIISFVLAFVLILSACASLASCGTPGADGKTPYIGENGNWWVGDTDLNVPARGPAGETPFIASNGNWWIGTTDTGVKAKPEDGKTPYIGENGNWWVGDTDLNVPATGNGGTVPDEPGDEPEDEIGELTVSKISSHKYLRTVHPGDDVTYTFTVKNGTNVKKQFDIADVIPQSTTYKSGDATVSGNSLTINVNVDAGKTVTLSYTVTVIDDLTKCGTPVVSDSAEYLGNKISCEDIYIASTFNENDMEKVAMAIAALRNSEFGGKDLLKYYFYIAFGLSHAIVEDADTVAKALFIDSTLENSDKYAGIVIPGLYGGNKIASSHSDRFKGEATEGISAEDVFPGDVVIVLPSEDDLTGAKMYVTDGITFYDITGKTTETVTDYVLDSILVSDYFAVLRPISASKSVNYFRTQPLYEGRTDVEKAIIAAACAFVLRGDRMQYDDKYMATSVPRWERNKTPEDYTIDEIGYSDCTGFIHDVYYTALGWDYGNHALYNSNSSWFVYDYTLTHNETAEDIADIEAEVMSTLKPGDIVYYRYSTNNHGMLYLGNGTLVHCTGNTYNYSGPTEQQEPAIRFQNIKTLFSSGSRYIFQTDTPRSRFFILRPTNTWTDQIPEETLSRIQNMRGIVAEKLSSHPLGQTVNPGEFITYTFKIFNSNTYPVTLNVKDVIPEGTTLMLNGSASNETSLSWVAELQPGEEKLISYTVKVSETAAAGSAIVGSDESSVGGVSVRITPIFVGRTLTEAEQQALVEAVYACINGSEKDDALVDKIYKTAFGVDGIIGASMSEVRSSLFLGSGTAKTLATDGKFAEMVAPTLYGGKNVANSTRFDGERTRMPWERDLVVGDILFFATSSRFYMYIGDGKFIDMQTFKERDAFERLEETIGWQEFAVLRPSLAFED